MFSATYIRTSYKNESIQLYVLLENVKENNEVFRNHSWIKSTRRIEALNLKKGDRITFTARKEEYLSSEGPKIGLRHIRNVSRETI